MKSLASILAVGTEVSSGEIVNSNGAWIAERLEQLGFTVTAQLTVPDDRARIEKGIEWLALDSSLIVVIGGLGPTSDDFTREVIAKWAQCELVFSESVWTELNQLYEERGARIRPAHRQQCHFPKEAELLKNTVGTAHGFSLQSKGRWLVVLPGPPREIHGMWESSILPFLIPLAPPKTVELKTWTCTGITESGVAEITEDVLKGSGYKIGYRASKPLVKVKVWVPRDDDKAEEWVSRLDTALKKWRV